MGRRSAKVLALQFGPWRWCRYWVVTLLPVSQFLQPVQHFVVGPRDDVALLVLSPVDVSGLVGVDVEARFLLVCAAMEHAALVGILLAAGGKLAVVKHEAAAARCMDVAPSVGLARIQHADLERAQRQFQLKVQGHGAHGRPHLPYLGRIALGLHFILGSGTLAGHAIGVLGIDELWIDHEPVTAGFPFLHHLLRPGPVAEVATLGQHAAQFADVADGERGLVRLGVRSQAGFRQAGDGVVETGSIPFAGLGIAQLGRQYPVEEVSDKVIALHITTLKRLRALSFGANDHLGKVRFLRLAQQEAPVVALQVLAVDIVDKEPVERPMTRSDAAFLVLQPLGGEAAPVFQLGVELEHMGEAQVGGLAVHLDSPPREGVD